MESVKSGILRIFGSERILALVLFIAAAALSVLLYFITRECRPSAPLPYYSLQLEIRSATVRGSYNFIQGCIFSDTGLPCRSASTQAEIPAGMFSYVKLSADAFPGNYHGIRVQIRGGRAEPFYLKSAVLQGRKIFDGKNAFPLKNIHGMRVERDSRT